MNETGEMMAARPVCDEELRAMLDRLLACRARAHTAIARADALHAATREAEIPIVAELLLRPEHGVRYRGSEFEVAACSDGPPSLCTKELPPPLDEAMEQEIHHAQDSLDEVDHGA